MIKTLALLFAVYHFTSAVTVWIPIPTETVIPAVPAQPQATTTQAPIVEVAPILAVAPGTTTTTQAPIVEVAPVAVTPGPVTPAPIATPAPITPVTPAPVTPVTPAPVTPVTQAPEPIQTMPLLPAGQFYGHFGQICDFSISPIRDVVCKAQGQIGIEQYAGFMKCERGYDCCLCGAVTCGNEWQGCNTFSVGDFGVKGVKDISIIGRNEQLGGGQMNFIGIEAGANAMVYGENIKAINAAGPLSLYNAQITVRNPTADFSVECVGEMSCENLKLEVIIPGPPPGYVCNPAWAPNGIEFNSLQCSGVNACTNAEITIRNEGCAAIEIQQIECTLPTACINTKFDFIETNAPIGVNNCDIGNSMQVPMGLSKCFGAHQGPNTPPWNPQQWLPQV